MSKGNPKLRLLASHKQLLFDNAAKHILPKALKDAYDAAYAKAAPLAFTSVTAKFKQSEMDVLEKFGCATRTNSARLHYTSGAVQVFDWRPDTKDEEKPKVPSSHEYRYSQMYQADQKTADAVDAWVKTRDAYTTEYDKRKRSYQALIQGANYLEDLLDIWPEAAALVPRTGGAIIALGPDQIEAVKRDLAEQRKNSTAA